MELMGSMEKLKNLETKENQPPSTPPQEML
jgi:hypothetical protein